MSTIIVVFNIRITQCVPEKQFSLGVKSFVYSNDYVSTFAPISVHTNITLSSENAWTGSHAVLTTSTKKDGIKYMNAEWNYGSGSYNRPASITSIYLIKY